MLHLPLSTTGTGFHFTFGVPRSNACYCRQNRCLQPPGLCSNKLPTRFELGFYSNMKHLNPIWHWYCTKRLMCLKDTIQFPVPVRPNPSHLPVISVNGLKITNDLETFLRWMRHIASPNAIYIFTSIQQSILRCFFTWYTTCRFTLVSCIRCLFYLSTLTWSPQSYYFLPSYKLSVHI